MLKKKSYSKEVLGAVIVGALIGFCLHKGDSVGQENKPEDYIEYRAPLERGIEMPHYNYPNGGYGKIFMI